MPLGSVLASEEAWQEAVRHGGGVALPVLPVFAETTVLIPKAAVGQQDCHVNDVEVRQDVFKPTSQAVGQGAHQIARVVEVACPAPEARGHQLAVELGAIHRHVGALDVLRLLPPDLAVAIRTTEEVLLVVCRSEDVVANQAQYQDAHGISCAQLHRVVNQIQALGSRKERCSAVHFKNMLRVPG